MTDEKESRIIQLGAEITGLRKQLQEIQVAERMIERKIEAKRDELKRLSSGAEMIDVDHRAWGEQDDTDFEGYQAFPEQH